MNIKEFSKISINSFFVYEAEEIEMAIKIGKQLRSESLDTKSAGEEVEIAVREMLKRKFSAKFYITKGHIIDRHLNVSQQCDVIISDNFKSPILYKSRDETEFIMYESVYSIGEVKSSYYEKDLIRSFSNNIKRMKDLLKRSDVSPNFIDTGGGEGIMISQKTTSLPIKNPLFSFMFFGDVGSFRSSYIKELYADFENWKYLPNIVCVMNLGLILMVNTNSL